MQENPSKNQRGYMHGWIYRTRENVRGNEIKNPN